MGALTLFCILLLIDLRIYQSIPTGMYAFTLQLILKYMLNLRAKDHFHPSFIPTEENTMNEQPKMASIEHNKEDITNLNDKQMKIR